MYIAGHEVELITRDSAKVGCTNVTRSEAEALLAEMNKIPEENFKVWNPPEASKDPRWVNICVSRPVGWFAASEDSKASYYSTDRGFRQKFFAMCVTREHAEKLLRFLAEQLGYVVYKPSSITQAKNEQKYIIEYHDGSGRWTRSGNKGMSGEFGDREVAEKTAAHEQARMGHPYYYRAVPLT